MTAKRSCGLSGTSSLRYDKKYFVKTIRPATGNPQFLLAAVSGSVFKLIIMNEAIFILEKEKKLLEDVLKGWKTENHPDAFRQRNKKLKEIGSALDLLKRNNI